MGARAPHSGGQRDKMKSLSSLERTMERWSNVLWTLLTPPSRKHREQAEVVRILHQECDDRALILDRQRTLVPNAFVVELPPASHVQLVGSSEPLARWLSEQLRRHAAEQGYTFAGPVAIRLAPVQGSEVGRFRVRSCIAPAQNPAKREPGPS